MRYNRILFALFCVSAGWLPAGEAAPLTDAKAVLVIHVKNGTQGGQVAAGTPVTVNFYKGDQLERQASVQTDSQGNCLITDILSGPDRMAAAQAKHSDMAFSSPPLPLPAGQKRYDLSLQVFDVAYDNASIRAGTHHLILKTAGTDIHVSEYLQLVNDTDKAVLSDDTDSDGRPKVIEIALPQHYRNLSFSSYFHSDAIVQTQTGFYDTMAIPPGTYHAVFSYDIPRTAEAIDFVKSVTLPTQSMMVFLQADSGIASDLGEPAGQMTLREGILTNYYTVDVSPGSVLKFHAPGVVTGKPPQNEWMILGVVFAAVFAAGLIRMVKQRPAV